MLQCIVDNYILLYWVKSVNLCRLLKLLFFSTVKAQTFTSQSLTDDRNVLSLMDKRVQIILKQLFLQIHAVDLWTPETIRVYQIFSSISDMEIKSNKRKMLGSDRAACSKEDLLESERCLVCSPESETEQKIIIILEVSKQTS